MLREKEMRLLQAREEKMMKKSKAEEMKRNKLNKLPKLPKIRPPSKAMLREIARRERQKIKNWREKDKKELFENVKIRYLQYRKMKVNLVRVDTLRKERRQIQIMQS